MKKIVLMQIMPVILSTYVYAADFSAIAGNWCGNDDVGSLYLEINTDGSAASTRQLKSGQLLQTNRIHFEMDKRFELILNESDQKIKFPISINFQDGQKSIYFEPAMHVFTFFNGSLSKCE